MNGSRLFNEYIKRFPEDRFTQHMLFDLKCFGTVGGHTGGAIYEGDLDEAMFRSDREVRPRLEEITGITYLEMSKKYNTLPRAVYKAYADAFKAEWGVW